jgi:hypothetical protein
VARQDISWLRSEIVVGVNLAHRITVPQGWVATYTTTADWLVARDAAEEWAMLDGIRGPLTRLVLSNTILRVKMTRTFAKRPNHSWRNLVTRRGVSLRYGGAFDWNCAGEAKILRGTSSVGMMALPWALFLGLNPIYLLGCDCTARGHAYADGGKFSPRALFLWQHKFKPGMAMIRKAVEARGRKIFNATLGGSLEAFERVDFDSLKGG